MSIHDFPNIIEHVYMYKIVQIPVTEKRRVTVYLVAQNLQDYPMASSANDSRIQPSRDYSQLQVSLETKLQPLIQRLQYLVTRVKTTANSKSEAW